MSSECARVFVIECVCWVKSRQGGSDGRGMVGWRWGQGGERAEEDRPFRLLSFFLHCGRRRVYIRRGYFGLRGRKGRGRRVRRGLRLDRGPKCGEVLSRRLLHAEALSGSSAGFKQWRSGHFDWRWGQLRLDRGDRGARRPRQRPTETGPGPRRTRRPRASTGSGLGRERGRLGSCQPYPRPVWEGCWLRDTRRRVQDAKQVMDKRAADDRHARRRLVITDLFRSRRDETGCAGYMP
ncbi:hypothetical protein BZA05DRAFT_88056 [Tricharina praecox]|uniref:uncharacterized protein n=1 Tax=Tricharina praecox TaxID=43433 RepID=UPI00221FB4D9|nr:uncharacterized protein BZA05DRAFT_88056 [Tricharina praecox]KAI5848824.1 hypothetical protein BZA05DRAFT_88056 [Tricharina praecox]